MKNLRDAYQLFNSGNDQTKKQINEMLWQVVPFNAPHEITVTEWSNNKVSAKIPLTQNNFNHLKGIHACGLATVSEYVSGLLLLTVLGIENYRIIMSKLDVEYTYQARTDCVAEFHLPESVLTSEILTQLEQNEKIVFPAKVAVKDNENNTVCKATIYWQIKSWDKVNLK